MWYFSNIWKKLGPYFGTAISLIAKNNYIWLDWVEVNGKFTQVGKICCGNDKVKDDLSGKFTVRLCQKHMFVIDIATFWFVVVIKLFLVINTWWWMLNVCAGWNQPVKPFNQNHVCTFNYV